MKFIYTYCLILLFTISTRAQYTDLSANITWTGPNVSLGTATVDEIETAYNYARTQENTDLSTNLPQIDFPEASVWQTMNTNARALWIINKERIDRGIQPLEGTAPEVIDVAQQYCQFLIDNDTTGHYADGHNPLYRLQQNATIQSCMQAYNENIGYSYSNNSVPPTFVLERLLYWLIYEDASANWGHRQNFFKSNFTDNSGEIGKEGLLGVGYVVGTSYKTYNYAAFIVCNIIDPCDTWNFPTISIETVFPSEYIAVKNSQIILSHIPRYSTIELCTLDAKVLERVVCSSESYTSSIVAKGTYIIRVIEQDSTMHYARVSVF